MLAFFKTLYGRVAYIGPFSNYRFHKEDKKITDYLKIGARESIDPLQNKTSITSLSIHAVGMLNHFISFPSLLLLLETSGIRIF